MTIPGLVIAVPKGRILEELTPLFKKVGIVPEKAFFDDGERQLQFACENSTISLIRVRSFDVATFVAFGAEEIPAALQMADQAVGLVLSGDGDAADARIHRV